VLLTPESRVGVAFSHTWTVNGTMRRTQVVSGGLLETASWFCLLFGAACQFLAGVMSLANKNTLGGTLLTTFSFNRYVLSEASQVRHRPRRALLVADRPPGSPPPAERAHRLDEYSVSLHRIGQ
jgi:hypothetical protein